MGSVLLSRCWSLTRFSGLDVRRDIWSFLGKELTALGSMTDIMCGGELRRWLSVCGLRRATDEDVWTWWEVRDRWRIVHSAWATMPRCDYDVGRDLVRSQRLGYYARMRLRWSLVRLQRLGYYARMQLRSGSGLGTSTTKVRRRVTWDLHGNPKDGEVCANVIPQSVETVSTVQQLKSKDLLVALFRSRKSRACGRSEFDDGGKGSSCARELGTGTSPYIP